MGSPSTFNFISTCKETICKPPQSNTTAKEYHTKCFISETFILAPFTIHQAENIILMYSRPFSPSSWTHFLFLNNTIRNDHAFWVLKKTFDHGDEYSKIKKWGKPDVYHKDTYSHQLIIQGDVVAGCGHCHPHVSKPNSKVCSLRSWGGLVGCKVLILLAVRHQGEFFVLFCCCFGRSKSVLKNRLSIITHFVRMIILGENVHLPTIGMHTAIWPL